MVVIWVSGVLGLIDSFPAWDDSPDVQRSESEKSESEKAKKKGRMLLGREWSGRGRRGFLVGETATLRKPNDTFCTTST